MSLAIVHLFENQKRAKQAGSILFYFLTSAASLSGYSEVQNCWQVSFGCSPGYSNSLRLTKGLSHFDENGYWRRWTGPGHLRRVLRHQLAHQYNH